MANEDDAKQALLPRTQGDSGKNGAGVAQRRPRFKHGNTEQENQEENSKEVIIPTSENGQLNCKKVLLFLTAYLTIGAISFFLIKDQIKGTKTNSIVDAVYFCVVTMTTVGYGDLVPETRLAKSFACIFVFTGMALVGFVLSKAADYILEKEEIIFVKAIQNIHQLNPNNNNNNNNNIVYKFLTTLALILFLMIIGTLFLNQVEGLDIFDSMYGVCATMTTLGYGDKSFSTKSGRLFAIFWILISTISLAQLFLYVAQIHTERRSKTYINWVLQRKMTLSDLESADLDHDNTVSVAEFVVHKLKEMEKISDEDVSTIVEIFKKLDVDHSGNLTASDLAVISQSSQLQSQI